MTIFDLVEAFKRYWQVIVAAFVILIILVTAMTFQISDGKVTLRAAPRYESAVQIAVVPPGTDSFISLNARNDTLVNAASLYASLLESDEAADWIGDANGYELEEAVNTSKGRDSSVFTALVTAPSPEQAKAAALSTFEWLNKKLQEPIETANLPTPTTTVPLIILDSDFSSFVRVTLDAGLAKVNDDVFLFVDVGDERPTGLPLPQSADSTVRTRATLAPLTTVILTLRTSSDEVLDTVRLAPEPAPSVVEAVPELSISLDGNSIRRTAATSDGTAAGWEIVPSGVSMEWLKGTSTVAAAGEATTDIDLALLTPQPGVSATGTRRGPIAAIAALLIGSVLILASVIVADTWRVERDERAVSELKLTLSGGASSPNGSTSGVEEAGMQTSEVEVQTTSIET